MLKLLNSNPLSVKDVLFYTTGKHKNISTMGDLKVSLLDLGFPADTVTFVDISDICMLDDRKSIILCQQTIQNKERIFFVEIPEYLSFMFKSTYYGAQENLYSEIKSMYKSSADDMIDILRWYKAVLNVNLTEKQATELLNYANEMDELYIKEFKTNTDKKICIA